jgi:hypothetical protein
VRGFNGAAVGQLKLQKRLPLRVATNLPEESLTRF